MDIGKVDLAAVAGLNKPRARLFLPLAIVIALFHLWANTLGLISELWMSALHFASFGTLCVLLLPAGEKPWQRGYDLLVALAAILPAFYLIAAEDALYARGVDMTIWDMTAATLAILAALELTRRTTGWFIPALIMVSLTYVFLWGNMIGGVFRFAGLSLETVLFRSYFSGDGMFGPIARISWTYVFMFILFGAFLVKSGADRFIIDLARVAAGRFAGGPGFVAVLASGLMGSVSGSSVANTMSTGIITIPLMRRAGFPPRFAAGVEAAASTGGQLMPPVMGAGAFIMASYTGLSYLTIIAAAALPAVLYFMSVAYFVRIEARRSHAEAMAEEEEQPRILDVIAEGWQFIIPMGVLVWMLVIGFTPTFAAGYAIIAVIAASWLKLLRGKKGMTPRDVVDALALGARNATTMALLLVSIGLVVNVVSMTGVGNTFSLLIGDWSGGNLFIMLVLVALASLVLGMGLPVTAAYIVLATLSAPAIYGLIVENALIAQIAAGELPEAARGIFLLFDPQAMTTLAAPMPEANARALVGQLPDEIRGTLYQQALNPAVLTTALLSAHMIIFWLSQDSNVTPPVCLTAFAAAAIAGTPPMRTGFTAWKLAKGLYIVPLLIAYTPFLGPDFWANLEIFLFALLGIYALAAAIEGWAENRLSWLGRAVFAALAALLMWPLDLLWVEIGAALALIAAVWWNRRRGEGKAALP